MGYLRYIGCGALSLVCFGSAAAAQSERRLDVTFTTRTVYDSNFARSSRAQAEARGIEPEELRFSPALGVEAALPFGPHLVTMNASAGYDFHARNTRFNRERIEGRMGLASRFGRCRTELEATFARRQTELEDIIVGPVENAETVKAAQLRASCPREVGLVPALLLRARSIDNSQTLRQSADSDTRTAEAGLTYVRPSLGEAGLFVRASETLFPNRLLAGAGGSPRNDGFAVSNIGVRFARNIGVLLRGSASLAHTDVERRGATDAFSGLTYTADLLVRPQGRLSARLLAEKKVEPSNRIGVSYSIDDIYRVETLYALSPRVAITAGASARDREFEGFDRSGVGSLTEERTTAVFGSLRVEVRPGFTVVLDALREKRETTVPLFDYRATRLGLSTRLVF